MSLHVSSSEGLIQTRDLTETIAADGELAQARWSEYLKFLAVVGALAATIFLGPLLAMLGMSFVVTLFGWLLGGLSL